jgi:hypothetical protein
MPMNEPNDATGPGSPPRASSGGKTWIIVLVVVAVAGLCLVPVAVVVLGAAVFFVRAGPDRSPPAVQEAPLVAPGAPDAPAPGK